MDVKEVFFFVLALKLDIFFASLYLGTKIRNKKDMQKAVFILTGLQCIPPFLGLYIGKIFGIQFGKGGANLGAAMLIIIGYEMIKGAIKKPSKSISNTSILLIYLGAETEEFFAGVSVGMLDISTLLFMFVLIAETYLVNLFGLKLGSTAKRFMNCSVDMITGIIIISIGIASLLNIL